MRHVLISTQHQFYFKQLLVFVFPGTMSTLTSHRENDKSVSDAYSSMESGGGNGNVVLAAAEDPLLLLRRDNLSSKQSEYNPNVTFKRPAGLLY